MPVAITAPPLAPAPEIVYIPIIEPPDAAARHLLAYQQRVTQLNPGELSQEVQRLNDNNRSLQGTMELALALGYTRVIGDIVKAQGLLEGVLRNDSPPAQAWHPMARLLATRYAEQRRAEEQNERLNQQLRDVQRDNQRKLDQLNEKLEALKAIERSINSRPLSGSGSGAGTGAGSGAGPGTNPGTNSGAPATPARPSQ